VHSLPEGFAVGTAWASDQAGLGFFVLLTIALQNIPEGTSVSIPMEAAGFGRAEQFWAAVGTSLPQPFGAVVAFLLVDLVQALPPFSLAFAAGAMLALVGIELLPQALEARRYLSVTATSTRSAAVPLRDARGEPRWGDGAYPRSAARHLEAE